MPIKFMAALFTGLFVISHSVIAEECSSRLENSVSIMDCFSARYKAADQELNAVSYTHLDVYKRQILVKLAYRHGVDAETLLALRMAFSLPFFVAMGWISARQRSDRLTRRDWAWLFGLGLLGYYLASYLDFLGLRYISAALERLILFVYPTLVVLLSAVLFGQRITGRVWSCLLYTSLLFPCSSKQRVARIRPPRCSWP